MCWHMCNACNEANKKDTSGDNPCLLFIPHVDETGAQGCPYFIQGEDNEEIVAANWVAISDYAFRKLLRERKEVYHDDSELDLEEQEYNKEYIDGYI